MLIMDPGSQSSRNVDKLIAKVIGYVVEANILRVLKLLARRTVGAPSFLPKLHLSKPYNKK